MRLCAILNCFSSWGALVTGDDKAAFEHLVQAEAFFHLASQQPIVDGNEGLACGVILQIVTEKLGDSKRLPRATAYLKRFPPERVKAMREVFALRSRNKAG